MKVRELIEILSKNPELELGQVRFSIFNPDEDKHKHLSDLVCMFGKFESKRMGNEIYMAHESENISVTIWNYDRCTIIGKVKIIKMVKKPISSETVDVEEITECLVTDCELKEGKYKDMEIVPLKTK